MTTVRGAILLVDDQAKILKTLGRALREAGHEVVQTTDPRHAQRLLGERPFDVLVVDHIMPALSGLGSCDAGRGAHRRIRHCRRSRFRRNGTRASQSRDFARRHLGRALPARSASDRLAAVGRAPRSSSPAPTALLPRAGRSAAASRSSSRGSAPTGTRRQRRSTALRAPRLGISTGSKPPAARS